MNLKYRTAFIFLFGLFAGMMAMYLYKTYKIEKRDAEISTEVKSEKIEKNYKDQSDFNSNKREEKSNTERSSSNPIDELTSEDVVIQYVKKNHELPSYYITKSQAKKQGWVASQGNLCDVLPGKAIGGDKFSNREGTLPKGPQYFEADVNYNCGRRNADRIVFTKEGEVYLTKNHYKSFDKQ